MASPVQSIRIKITLRDGKVLHNGDSCRVVLTEKVIKVGCTDVEIEVIKKLMAQHDEAFVKEIVVQP